MGFAAREYHPARLGARSRKRYRSKDAIAERLESNSNEDPYPESKDHRRWYAFFSCS